MKRSCCLLILAVLASAVPSQAGESLFNRVYTVETVPAGVTLSSAHVTNGVRRVLQTYDLLRKKKA